MPPLMHLSARFALFVLMAGLVGLGACGKEIGDACQFSTDCSPNGDRLCDNSLKDGYCTVFGCDYTTCPEDSVCVQFFTGTFSNKACDHTKLDDAACTLDELCAVNDHCVPRSSEVRYCMRTCGTAGDCRDGYECRNLDKMVAHGGQPVLPPGQVVSQTSPNFCASAAP
jgi:hypothetical protein